MPADVVQVPLSRSLRAFIAGKVSSGQFTTPEEYVSSLVEEACRREEQSRLEAMPLWMSRRTNEPSVTTIKELTIMRCLLSVVVWSLLAVPALAGVQTKTIAYKDGDVELEGFLAWDDAATGKRPGVLVVHEWWGLNDYARDRAKQLAAQGYVAFAPDRYGKGKTTEHPKEASEWAGTIRKNQEAWRKRAVAGLDILRKQENVDGGKLAAIGYCFGGSTCLQLAYAGQDLKAVGTFHAALPTPKPEEAKAIKARVLVCHGADDTFISQDAIKAFKGALDGAKIEYRFVAYEGARHSFTVPGIDAKGVDGLKYDKAADEASWKELLALLKAAVGST